jgi:hypothetical protein
MEVLMKRSSSSLIAVSAFALMACRGEAPQQQPTTPAQAQSGQGGAQLSPEEAANARRVIVAFLECEECESGELEAVVKLGQTAVPTLAATLREGPAPAARESQRQHLANTYAQLRKQPQPEAKVTMSEDEYVKMYMDNYEALHRTRAAQALAAIGGPEAQRALEAAKGLQVRPDVRDAVNQALQKIRR